MYKYVVKNGISNWHAIIIYIELFRSSYFLYHSYYLYDGFSIIKIFKKSILKSIAEILWLVVVSPDICNVFSDSFDTTGNKFGIIRIFYVFERILLYSA